MEHEKNTNKLKSNKWFIISGVVILIVVGLFLLLTNLMTNLRLFSELGYASVFFTRALTQLSIGMVTFLLVGVSTSICLDSLKTRKTSEESMVKNPDFFSWGIAMLFAGVVAYYTAITTWFELLTFMNSTPFNMVCPMFGMDISFYIFRLDLLRIINTIAIGVVVGLIIMTVVYSMFLTSSRRLKDILEIAENQLKVLGVLFFIMFGVAIFLGQFDLLQSTRGMVFGAGFTDTVVILWMYRMLAVMAIVAAIGFVVGFNKRKIKTILIVPAIMVITVMIGGVSALLVQEFVVGNNEFERERQFLERDIEHTRFAYNILDVRVINFPHAANLSRADIENNMETISNIERFLSDMVTYDSSNTTNRNIVQRANRLMPKLKYDAEPYLVIVDDREFWIVSAYTVSSNFPYSRPFEVQGMDNRAGINYIRNSVKVVIDAYDGTTTFYVIDETDPIIQTYRGIFPVLFRGFDEMSKYLQEHLRYPNMLFDIQAHIFASYHITDTRAFYTREALMQISQRWVDSQVMREMPKHHIFKLPEEETVERLNLISFTPPERANMVGLLVARNDIEHYGELVWLQLPAGRTVASPEQIWTMMSHGHIEELLERLQRLYSGDIGASSVSRIEWINQPIAIPIGDSLLYVNAAFVETNGVINPETMIVAVAILVGEGISQPKLAFGTTLTEALDELFDEPFPVYTETDPQYSQ